MTSNQHPITIAGIMSGTSMDGLDIAICSFQGDYPHIKWSIIKTQAFDFPQKLKTDLQKAHTLSGYELSILDIEFGKFIADCILQIKQDIDIEAIASHGHTVFHEPNKSLSLQIGSGAVIYANTNIRTITNFRAIDVALGGQGAPLVPIGDALLFSNYSACLNLGGIANISFSEYNKRIGFDMCPCNILLNKVSDYLGFEYDEGGNQARKGQLIETLLEQLSQWDYYKQPIPKSLDKETMLSQLWNIITPYLSKPNDVLYTLVEHISNEIVKVLEAQISNVLVTGGGAFNTYLIERMQHKTKCEIIIPDNQIIAFKEAIVFALLGYLRLKGSINIYSSVTGARIDSVGGSIWGV